MSVHYKFKSALEYSTVAFDGLHISVGELKAAIGRQKHIGRAQDLDLQITNAQTKEVYSDDNALIPKNTSLLVARVPVCKKVKKSWRDDTNTEKVSDVAVTKGLADLSRMEGTEQDKISAMISQSTLDYDPSNYQVVRGQNQRGEVPATYRCYKCHKTGHWIKNCPIANIPGAESLDIRRSSGIPRSFMVPVDGPKAPGAMMTPTGNFAVPVVDHEAYQATESGDPAEHPPAAEHQEIPEDLICSLCRDLLTDAVMIPCCGNSFCDECIRNALLDSEDHECPDCREKDIAPTTLIPNRFLRNSVSSFRNQTGYSRRMPHRSSNIQQKRAIQEHPPPNVTQLPPPNGQPPPAHPHVGVEAGAIRAPVGVKAVAGGEESDGSFEDNITVMVPSPSSVHARQRPPHHTHRSRQPRYGPTPHGMNAGMEGPSGPPPIRVREEQRASTPTIDERRDPVNPQVVYGRPPVYVQGAPGQPLPAGPPVHFAGGYPPRGPPPDMRGPPFNKGFPVEPYQPPPPGIKESLTTRPGEDPLEAFNRMIREKEERAKRREVERRRLHSPSSRSPPPRSPLPRVRSRSPQPRVRSRSPQPRVRSRSPQPRVRSRSPQPRVRSRSPQPRVRSPPPRVRSRTPRSRTRSPVPRPRTPPSRGSSRVRYSRSRSLSRGRVRRSPPWSPRRRRTRERTLSLTRSPSPRRRRSPPRFRSPLRSPPLRAVPVRSSPHRPPLRTPPRSVSPPHRYVGVYDDLHSPHRQRNVDPPYGSRYGPRSNGPPTDFPSMGTKPVGPMGDMPPLLKDPSPMYRGRYNNAPFEDIPPGSEPPVPGYEPPPFERPPMGMSVDRMPPVNMRDGPFHRGPYPDVPQPYRDMPPIQKDMPPMHLREEAIPPFREDYRGPMPYRDGPPVIVPPYRDGQPYRDPSIPAQQFRDSNYRGGPPQGFRDNGQFRPNNSGPPFRDNGPPHGFRDNNYREPPGSFRPPDGRNAIPGQIYQDPNIRDGFRDAPPPLMPDGRDHVRGGFRPGPRNARGGARRNYDNDRRNERDGRPDRVDQDGRPDRVHRDGRPDREYRDRYSERDTNDKVREPDNKRNYDRTRDDRTRDHDRNRDVDKDRDRDRDRERERDRGEYERGTPERKKKAPTDQASPKRSKAVETREKKRSESRGHSKEREKREKKEEKVRDKSADRKFKEKEQKEKERKVKERKKKKKEKDPEKKKKKEKKDKKDKDESKDEDEDIEKENQEIPTIKKEPETTSDFEDKLLIVNQEKKEQIDQILVIPKIEQCNEKLYSDIDTEAVDEQIMENYLKTGPEEPGKKEKEIVRIEPEKRDSFDGLELQAATDDLDLKPDNDKEKEMLAPLPELSKWEVDEDNAGSKEPGEITSPEPEKSGTITSEVIKRAENAIFAKGIGVPKSIEIKKISNDRLKLYSDVDRKEAAMNNIQITVPVAMDHRSIEITDKKKKRSKTPTKLSVKERLGGKIENPPRNRDERVIHSTVERIKGRSKTPKRDHPYRRVTVDTRTPRPGVKVEDTHESRRNDPSRREERRVTADTQRAEGYRKPDKPDEKKDERYKSPSKDKARKKEYKAKKSKEEKPNEVKQNNKDRVIESASTITKERVIPERDRKRSTLDEANFEPDYDEHLETEETKEETKKRERSKTPVKYPPDNVCKRAKTIEEVGAVARAVSPSESSSLSDSSSSSSESDRKRKKKKKKSKRKKKKKAASDSDSDSDGSSSDEPKKKKKKRKHKKKSSKKKKKHK